MEGAAGFRDDEHVPGAGDRRCHLTRRLVFERAEYSEAEAKPKDAACRFESVRAGPGFDVLRFVPVRVKIRLRVTRFVSRMSEIGLRVMHVGIRVPHCVFLYLCVSCVSRVTRGFGSCPCQVFACLRFVFVFARPCKSSQSALKHNRIHCDGIGRSTCGERWRQNCDSELDVAWSRYEPPHCIESAGRAVC
jgi:hypothetical protein